MNTTTLFFILSLLPIFYPIIQLFKKKDLNLWDFLLFFSCIFFSLIPAIYSNLGKFEPDLVKNVSYIVFIFHFLLLIVDFNFRNKHDKEFRILNICYYLRHIQHLRLSLHGKFIVAVGLAVIIVFYLPRMSIAVRMGESSSEATYTISSIAMALNSILSIIGVILTLATLTDLKSFKKDKILIILVIVYLGIMIFMPRRIMVFSLLQFAIVYYALFRKKISKKIISYVLIIFMGIYFVYFPFYNVIRWNNVSFNPRHPIESLTAIINYGINNFSNQLLEASHSTDERTLGLYQALYNLFKNCTDWGNGSLTIAAIDGAIPRVLNPNKGDGTEQILENMSKSYTDQADSILLEACGDFASWGALYAVVLFFVLFWLYEKYSYLYFKMFKSYLVPTFIMFEMLSITWNIEGNLGGRIAFFFSSIFAILLLLLLERFKVVVIKRRHFIKEVKVIKKSENSSESQKTNENSLSLS